MKTDGIIFDVDGTLWDATQRIAEAYTVILKWERIANKVITADMLASVMGLLNEDIAARLFPELPYERRMRLIEACCEFECEYLRKHGGSLFPHVVDVLKQLSAKYPLYIVSNCQDGYIEAMFAVHDLQKYFKVRVLRKNRQTEAGKSEIHSGAQSSAGAGLHRRYKDRSDILSKGGDTLRLCFLWVWGSR